MERNHSNPNFPNPNYNPESWDLDTTPTTPNPTQEAANQAFNKNQETESLLAEQQQRIEALRSELAALKQDTDRPTDELREAYTKIFTDPLTGCPNRLFVDEIYKDIFDPEKDDGKVCAIFADINGLKAINDNFGHQAGDERIIVTSQFLQEAFAPEGREEVMAAVVDHSINPDHPLKETLSQHNIVIHMSGDEFLIICHNTAQDPVFSTTISNKLSDLSFETDHMFSSGSAVYDKTLDNHDFSHTMSRADSEMYKNKRAFKSSPSSQD